MQSTEFSFSDFKLNKQILSRSGGSRIYQTNSYSTQNDSIDPEEVMF